MALISEHDVALESRYHQATQRPQCQERTIPRMPVRCSAHARSRCLHVSSQSQRVNTRSQGGDLQVSIAKTIFVVYLARSLARLARLVEKR